MSKSLKSKSLRYIEAVMVLTCTIFLCLTSTINCINAKFSNKKLNLKNSRIKEITKENTDNILTSSDLSNKQLWEKYFKQDPNSDTVKCKDKPFDIPPYGSYFLFNPDLKLPYSKENPYPEGKELSNYFFDYIDPILLKDIVEEFTRVFEEALKQPKRESVPDIYDLNYLFVNEQSPDITNEKYIKKFMPNFDFSIYNKSITMSQMMTIIDLWNWGKRLKHMEHYPKYIIDKYDFNGDGRLNILEFTIANIISNYHDNNCKNCYEKIKKQKLYPIFTFIDCDNSGSITAESIWDAFPNLKRPKKDETNIFKCKLKERHLHTTSLNDFIIKSGINTIGLLNIKEFAVGVLLGFANRQINENGATLGNEINLKGYRWDGINNEKDLFCESLSNVDITLMNRKDLNKRLGLLQTSKSSVS